MSTGSTRLLLVMMEIHFCPNVLQVKENLYDSDDLRRTYLNLTVSRAPTPKKKNHSFKGDTHQTHYHQTQGTVKLIFLTTISLRLTNA